MTSSVPLARYPVAIVQDRYQGTYSSGEWLAIANADQRHGEMARSSWVLTFGPHDSDVEAAAFWASPPGWIAVGATPDEALKMLLKLKS